MRVLATAIGLAVSAPAWAQHLYVPEQTWAFEDVTDAFSDEDHNDVVVRHASKCDLDANGDVVRIAVHLTAVASGASRTNRLLYTLPAPGTVTLHVGDYGAPGDALPVEAGRAVVLHDFRDAFDAPPTGFVNTLPGSPIVSGTPLILAVTLTTPTDFGGGCPVPQLAIDRPADGVLVDGSTRLGANQRPLAGNFDGFFQPPAEHVRIGTAYPDFLAWVVDVLDGTCDSECADPDDLWFDRPATEGVLERPDLVTTAPLPPFETCFDQQQNQDEPFPDCGGDVCGPCCGSDAVLGAAPVALWHLGEASGDAVDVVGGQDGLVLDAPVRAVGSVADDGDRAIRLVGGTSRVAIPSFTGFPSTGLTVELWARADGAGTAVTMLSYAVPAEDDEVWLSSLSSVTWTVHGSSLNTGFNAADGRWHHLAATWRSADGAAAVYVDGVLRGSGALAPGATLGDGGTIVLGQDQDVVGGGYAANQAFNGAIDEVVLFDEALDAATIAAHATWLACGEACGGGDDDGDGDVDEGWLGAGSACPALDCDDVDTDHVGDGLYWIRPASTTAKVYCDQTTDGGGWTLIVNLADNGYSFTAEAQNSGTAGLSSNYSMNVSGLGLSFTQRLVRWGTTLGSSRTFSATSPFSGGHGSVISGAYILEASNDGSASGCKHYYVGTPACHQNSDYGCRNRAVGGRERESSSAWCGSGWNGPMASFVR